MANKFMLALAFLLCSSVVNAGPIEELERYAVKSANETASNTLTQNEIDNILFKREVMSRPGLNLYVVFFDKRGNPMDYFVTDGKCTSSKKSLIAKYEFKRGQTGKTSKGAAVYGDFIMKSSSTDGTHGTSSPYIYCITVGGKYRQWNGRYYISDVPVELTIKPLFVSK